MGSSQVINLRRYDLGYREVGFCNFNKNLNFAKIYSQKNSRLCIGQSSILWPSKPLSPSIVKASGTSQGEAAVASEKASVNRRSEVVSFYFSIPRASLFFHGFYMWINGDPGNAGVKV